MTALFESIFRLRAGGVTTKAAVKALGTTDMGHTDVFLREAVQNSYDAKQENGKPLELFINCYHFDDEQCAFLRNMLAASGEHGKGLAAKINTAFYNIEIADRNSVGLTGKAGFKEEDTGDGEEERFHHFVYMTGNDENKSDLAGGSYGFGKAG